MKKQQQPTQETTARVQGLVTDGHLVASKDGRYVSVYFADGSKIREHKNRVLSVLGAPFTREDPKGFGDDMPLTLTTGFIAKTRMMLSKDGLYLTIYFPGGRFIRHVNYVRAVMGLESADKPKAS